MCVCLCIYMCVNLCSSVLFLFQDQYDVIEKHTQSGLDLVERYIKFVKERTEVEQNYAKQLRCAQWSLSEYPHEPGTCRRGFVHLCHCASSTGT